MTARRPLTLYGASTVKRSRRTRGELAALDAAIIAAVAADHPVTLRGVYYRVVSAGAVEKTELGYRAVGRRLLELRRAKVIPYSHITDGTRWVLRPETYADADDALDALAASYRRMLWRDQRVEVHLFSEKDAITGVVESVTARWDVPLGVLRGHCSESFAYKMAEAIDAATKVVYVYQLGDHDPSGADAWRDFQVKVTGFLRDLRTERIGHRAAARLVPAVFERIAVTKELALHREVEAQERAGLVWKRWRGDGRSEHSGHCRAHPGTAEGASPPSRQARRPPSTATLPPDTHRTENTR